MAWLATLPKGLRGYAIRERRHPPGKSTRHMHIKRRARVLYRVEWGTNQKTRERFVSVQASKEADKEFVGEIELWVASEFNALTAAYDNAFNNRPFTKVEWKR